MHGIYAQGHRPRMRTAIRRNCLNLLQAVLGEMSRIKPGDANNCIIDRVSSHVQSAIRPTTAGQHPDFFAPLHDPVLQSSFTVQGSPSSQGPLVGA